LPAAGFIASTPVSGILFYSLLATCCSLFATCCLLFAT